MQKEQLSEYWKKECERTKEEMTEYIRRAEQSKKTSDSVDINNVIDANSDKVAPNTPILDLINFLSKKNLQVSVA